MAVVTAPRFETALVIANPIAGRGLGRARAEALGRALEERGTKTRVYFTTARGDAQRELRELDAPPGVVVAVGGDGTVAEVLDALPEGVPLAVHPMGTANVMSRDLGLSRSVAGTVELIEHGRQGAIDVADVNGRTSFLVTGVGFDGAAVRDVERRRRGAITKWTYVRAVWSTLWAWRPPRLVVHLDGERQAGTFGWVLVSNIVGYGGFLRLWQGRRIDDGLYEVFCSKAAPAGPSCATLCEASCGGCRAATAGWFRRGTSASNRTAPSRSKSTATSAERRP